jgi:hypothetical protein
MDIALGLEVLLEEAGLARAGVSDKDDDFRRLFLVELGEAAGEERRRGGRVERDCGARGSVGVRGGMRARRTVVVVGRGVPTEERPVLAHWRTQKKLLGSEEAQAAVDGELCGAKEAVRRCEELKAAMRRTAVRVVMVAEPASGVSDEERVGVVCVGKEERIESLSDEPKDGKLAHRSRRRR